jgi:hypothetical protein
MKVIFLLFLSTRMYMCSMAPFIHALVSLPAVRETFRDKATINWLRDNIKIPDIEIVETLLHTVSRKIEFIKKKVPTSDIEATGVALRLEALGTKITSLKKNAHLLYCLGMCEYVRSIKNEHDPDFSYLKINSITKPKTTTLLPSEIYVNLIQILSSAEPFEKLVAATANLDLVVVDADYYLQFTDDFTLYGVFGYTHGPDLYLALNNDKYMFVPESERDSREVEDFNPKWSASVILIKDELRAMLSEHSSLYTNEKKKLAFLRALANIVILD